MTSLRTWTMCGRLVGHVVMDTTATSTRPPAVDTHDDVIVCAYCLHVSRLCQPGEYDHMHVSVCECVCLCV